MKTIMILDTETIGLEKRFMYDLGYIIARKNEKGIYISIEKKQFVIDQVYNNKMLFETAYYNEKRPKYISLLRGKKARIKKIGHATMIMRHDIEKFEVENVYAYNMPFDTSVLEFNSKVFNIINPIEHLPQTDIMTFACEFIHKTDRYLDFCETYGHITNANNLKTNAEITFKFVSEIYDFEESHTSLQDCKIELDILNYCIIKGADLKKEYKRQYVKSKSSQEFKLIVKDKEKKETEYLFNYRKKINSKKRNAIILQE